MPMIETMKQYVGTAKVVPDSRIPRRFIAISSSDQRRSRPTASWPLMNGSAEVAFCTPEETDTATVST